MQAKRLMGVVAALCIAAPAAHAAKDDITIVSLPGWPPFSGKDLPSKGFGNAVTKAALEQAGYNVTVKLLPWSRAKNLTQRGKYEMLVNVWYTEKRAKTLAYGDAFAKNRLVFATKKKDAFTFKDLDSLSGMTVGIARDYQYGKKFLNSDKFKRQQSPDLLTNLKKLRAGRIDALIGDFFIIKYLVNHKLPNLKGKLAYTDNAWSSKPLHSVVSREIDNTEEIVKAYNQGLKAIRENGTYAKIKKKHGLQ